MQPRIRHGQKMTTRGYVGWMDGSVDGREGDEKVNEERGKRQVKPIRPPTTKQNKVWRW